MRTFIHPLKILLLILSFLSVTRGKENPKPEVDWQIDFEDAKTASAEQDRPILIDFTGSDWCVLCKVLDRKVYQTDAFQTYAKANLVLFKADFPMNKKQPEHIDLQNEKLGKHYGVKDFPAVLLVDSEGKLLKKIPFTAEMTVEQFIQSLKLTP